MRTRFVLVVLVLLVTGAGFSDVCDWIYDCGCQSPWRGGSTACNIHHGHGTGPACPWCAHPMLGGAVALVGTVAAQLGILLMPGLHGVGLAVRFVLALAAFPAVAGTIGWIQGLLFGYWSAS